MTPDEQAAHDRIFGSRDTSKLQRMRQWWRDNKGQRALSLRQGLIDSFAPLERLERNLNDGTLMDAEWSATKAAHLTNHTEKQLTYLLRDGMVRLETDENGGILWFGKDDSWTEGGLEEIFRPIAETGKMDAFEFYLAANRAQRLMEEGRERLLTDDDIAKGLALGEKNPEFKVAQDKYARFNGKMLDMAETAA